MEMLSENLLKNKMEVFNLKRKMIKKKDKNFKIKSGRIVKQRSYSHREKSKLRIQHKKSTADLVLRPERTQRELMILLQSKSEKLYKTTDELVNIGKRIKKKQKKETLLRLVDAIELTNMALPYSKRKGQVFASIKILEEIQTSESIYKDFVKVIVNVFNDFLRVKYDYYLDNYITNETLKNTFKKVYAVDSDTKGISYNCSFLERLLVALNIQFSQFEEAIDEKVRRIQGLTGKLEEEASKNYEVVLRDEINTLNQKIEYLYEEKEAILSTGNNDRVKIRRLEEKIVDIRDAYNEANQKIELLDDTLGQRERTIKEMETEISDLKSLINSLKGNRMDNIEQVKGVKTKADKMTLTLKKFNDKILSLITENKKLKDKLKKIDYKNNLGYRDLTPRPDYLEIFKENDFTLKRELFGLKIEKEEISCANVINKLVKKINDIEDQNEKIKRDRERSLKRRRRKSFRKTHQPKRSRSRYRKSGVESNVRKGGRSPRTSKNANSKFSRKPSNFLQATKKRNLTFNERSDNTSDKNSKLEVASSARNSGYIRDLSDAPEGADSSQIPDESPRIILNNTNNLNFDKKSIFKMAKSLKGNGPKSEAAMSKSSKDDNKSRSNDSLGLPSRQGSYKDEYTEVKELNKDMNSIHENLNLLLGEKQKRSVR